MEATTRTEINNSEGHVERPVTIWVRETFRYSGRHALLGTQNSTLVRLSNTTVLRTVVLSYEVSYAALLESSEAPRALEGIAHAM